jgi:hypothetical protein
MGGQRSMGEGRAGKATPLLGGYGARLETVENEPQEVVI